MKKAEAVKKYGIMKQMPLNSNGITKCHDYRCNNHKYCKDSSKYSELEFFLALTAFERDGLYGYDSRKMTYEEALTAYNELKKDWDRPGRRAWNSINLIGLDEEGKYFTALT